MATTPNRSNHQGITLDDLAIMIKQGFDEQGTRINGLEIRLENFEKETKKQFQKIDQRFEQVDQKFGQIDRKFDQVDQKIDYLSRRLDSVVDDVADIKRTTKKLVTVKEHNRLKKKVLAMARK